MSKILLKYLSRFIIWQSINLLVKNVLLNTIILCATNENTRKIFRIKIQMIILYDVIFY